MTRVEGDRMSKRKSEQPLWQHGAKYVCIRPFPFGFPPIPPFLTSKSRAISRSKAIVDALLICCGL